MWKLLVLYIASPVSSVRACVPTPQPRAWHLSVWPRALSHQDFPVGAGVFCTRRRIRTAVGMSSGFTVERATRGAGAAGSPTELGAAAAAGAVAGIAAD